MRDKGYGRELSAENIYLNFFCFSLSCFGEESNNGIKEAEVENEGQKVRINILFSSECRMFNNLSQLLRMGSSRLYV